VAAEPFVREASGQVFAEFAADYRRAGLAIIPTLGGDGKRPCVKGFNRYRQAPSAGAIQVWVNKFPSANIAAVAGCSD